MITEIVVIKASKEQCTAIHGSYQNSYVSWLNQYIARVWSKKAIFTVLYLYLRALAPISKLPSNIRGLVLLFGTVYSLPIMAESDYNP